MSVVVLGMEMPNRCFECPVIDTEDGFWCSATNKSLRKEHGINLTRPKWCPLRPLPEKHGELIDQRVLLHDDWDFCDAEDAIRSAPVIIEAEG